MANYVIFGNTHFAERLCKHIQNEGIHQVLAFTQESRFINCPFLLELPVISFERLNETITEPFQILIAIGYSSMNNVRASVYDLCMINGFKVGYYVSKNAIVYSEISEGSLVFPGTMIGTDVIMGKCNIFEPCVLVGHDNFIGDFNFFAGSSTLGGYVNVGNHCFIGMNATLMNDVSIADYTLIGQMSNVLQSINDEEAGGVVVGNPAKLLPGKKSIDAHI